MEEPDSPEPDAPRLARRVDTDDPWTWAITPAMMCEVGDLSPMTNEECAAAARLLDELRVLHAQHRTAAARKGMPAESAQHAGAQHPGAAPRDNAA